MEENCITLGLLASAIQRNSVITEYQAELPVLFSKFPVAILHGILHMIVVIATLHSSHPLLPSVHKSILYICISIPSLQIGSAVPLFHRYALIYNIFVFLTYITLYNRF